MQRSSKEVGAEKALENRWVVTDIDQTQDWGRLGKIAALN